ncbi:MAG: RDD family protein [Myxococcaceae bacterium]
MQAPAGAQCAYHPGVAAPGVCSRCGSFVCAECTKWGNGALLCPRCFSPTLNRANRGYRFLANALDSFVVSVPAFMGMFGVMAVGSAFGEKKGEDLIALFAMLGLFGGAALGIGLQIFMQVQFGQSVAKRLFKIKVVRVDGSPVELWRIILIRNLAVHVVSQLCGLISIIDGAMIFGDEQRCLHDLIAETIVIDVSLEQ